MSSRCGHRVHGDVAAGRRMRSSGGASLQGGDDGAGQPAPAGARVVSPRPAAPPAAGGAARRETGPARAAAGRRRRRRHAERAAGAEPERRGRRRRHHLADAAPVAAGAGARRRARRSRFTPTPWARRSTPAPPAAPAAPTRARRPTRGCSRPRTRGSTTRAAPRWGRTARDRTGPASDGSVAHGTKVTELPSPPPDAISWLLLRVSSTSGAGRIQRRHLRAAARARRRQGARDRLRRDDGRRRTCAPATRPTTTSIPAAAGAAWLDAARRTCPTRSPPRQRDGQAARPRHRRSDLRVPGQQQRRDAGADSGATTYAWVFKAPNAILYDMSFVPVATARRGAELDVVRPQRPSPRGARRASIHRCPTPSRGSCSRSSRRAARASSATSPSCSA